MSIKDHALRGLNLLHGMASGLPAMGNFRPLKGSFSALDEMENGRLEGTLLARGQTPGPCPPDSMTEQAGFQQNDHQPWPYFWTVSKDARLVGKMLHWRDPQDRICTEAVYRIPRRRRLGEDSLFAQLFVPVPHELPGAWTSITSPWNDCRNYYHWMLDGLTRLAIRDLLPEKPRILLPPDVPKFVRETLLLLDLQDAWIPSPAECVSPEFYYFCSPTAMTGVWNPHGYQWLKDSFAPHFAPEKSGPPVFLTRRGQARAPGNLESMEKIFTKHGFEIVDCGAVPVSGQIAKLSAAPAVAGLHGAAMTNLLWVRPGTPVIEIFEPGYLNGCYEQIAFHGNLDYSHHTNAGDETLQVIRKWCAATSTIH